MTPQLTGALIGAAVGLAAFAFFRSFAARTEGMKPTPEQKRLASIFRLVGLMDLILFPVLGYLLMPMVMQ